MNKRPTTIPVDGSAVAAVGFVVDSPIRSDVTAVDTVFVRTVSATRCFEQQPKRRGTTQTIYARDPETGGETLFSVRGLTRPRERDRVFLLCPTARRETFPSTSRGNGVKIRTRVVSDAGATLALSSRMKNNKIVRRVSIYAFIHGTHTRVTIDVRSVCTKYSDGHFGRVHCSSRLSHFV